MLDTQLPWSAQRNPVTGARTVVDAQDCEIAQVFGDTENNDERAQLIAAAPQMLEALAACLVQLRATSAYDDAVAGEDDAMLAAVRNGEAAIAAAEGNPTADINQAPPTGEIWLSTIIRKGWEPRLSYATSKGEMIADLLEYCTETAEIEIEEAASIDEIADALGKQANEQLYWEQAR